MYSFKERLCLVTAVGVSAALVLASCAGSGGDEAASASDESLGYEWGSSSEEIKAAFSDVDPITIAYQPAAQSPNDGLGDGGRVKAFVDHLETLSDGKITVETTYAQGIAAYGELADALVDGRVDIAYMLPIYQPNQFPRFQEWVTATTLTGTSPLVDELTSNAAIGELAWSDEVLLSEFRDQGLEPLEVFNGAGGIFAMCAEEHDSPDDWNGNQVRVSGVAQTQQLEALNSSPVSVEYTETFEALQRGTVDCTLAATAAADSAGFMEVAPHVAYTTDVAFARGPGGMYAGSAWETWPLPVRQLVFDGMAEFFAESRRSDLVGNYLAAQTVREQDGTFSEMSPDLQEGLREASEGLVDKAVSEDGLPEGTTEAIPETIERWQDIVDELGYQDEGSFEDFDEWYPAEDRDFLAPLGDRYFEEVLLPHRPE